MTLIDSRTTTPRDLDRWAERRPAGTTAPVSVIIPAYGHADYIVASLESVLGQATPPREVIVVDDSSPDDTADRLAPLVRAGRIRYVRQPNAGMAAARNAGARLATSEYLYFLDDDDLLFPDVLPWLVEELDRHPDAAFVTGEMEVFSDRPPARPAYWSESWEIDRAAYVLFNQLGCPGQALIRRRAFEAVGGFDGSIWGTDDWDLWLRLLERFPGRAARRPVLAYRLHAHNASRNVARMYDSSLRVARARVRGFPAEDRPLLRRHSYARLRRYHVPRLADMARERARGGDWKLAAAAVRAWIIAWAFDIGARIALKLHHLRHGRWAMPPSDRVANAIYAHGDPR